MKMYCFVIKFQFCAVVNDSLNVCRVSHQCAATLHYQSHRGSFKQLKLVLLSGKSKAIYTCAVDAPSIALCRAL